MTETRLIDYSGARPAPATIKAYGLKGVVRYLGEPWKQLTKAEAAGLHAAGLGIALVFETAADEAKKGHAQGVADAKVARSKAAALGYPASLELYFAVDFDDVEPKAADVRPYFQGIADTLGARAGCYGEYDVIEAMADIIPNLWQAAAWSKGRLSSKAQLYQRATPKGRIPAETDECVVCHPLRLWGPKGILTVTPPGVVVPKPAPAPAPKPPVKKPTPTPAPKPVAHVKAKASVLMGVDTNINLRGKTERDYYAATFPDLHLCWNVRMPAANTHGVSGVIDAMLGHGVTFTHPRVIVTGKPACLDHRPIKDTVWIAGKKVRVVWQSLNDKRNADKTWQAPASVIVPWLVHLASTADIVWTDEALMPNIRKDLAAALGKDWTVLRAGEYMVATRNSVATPTAKGVERVLSHVPGLAGWRQDHWGDFEYDIDGHPLLIVGNHAPSAVANLTKAGAPKQVAAHESGDKALNGKVRAWLVSKGEPVKAF